jgi:hypothetical protein
MYFDVNTAPAKVRAQAAVVRQQILLERAFRRHVKALLDHQWRVAAAHAKQGVFDVEHVVNSLRGLLIKALSEQYTRVGQTFFLSTESSFASRQKGSFGPKEQKGMAEEFWQAFHRWTLAQALAKVKLMDTVTIKGLRAIISAGANNGDSYAVTAENIWASTGAGVNLKRAFRIARTEVHAASTYAVNESVRSTRVKFEREWVSMADERTRVDHQKANGQRRGMDEPFDVGGEKLMNPGDPKGSAGTTINCRCVVLYHTVRVGGRVQWV